MYLFLKIERTGGRVFLVFLGFPSPHPYISRQYSSTSTYLYIVTLEWNLKNIRVFPELVCKIEGLKFLLILNHYPKPV